jgi:uridylate kinase
LTAPSLEIIIEKVQILKLDEHKTLSNTVMMQKLRIDGVYCDKDPQMHQKCNDQNILRLEQRLLREKPFVDQLEAKLMQNSKT